MAYPVKLKKYKTEKEKIAYLDGCIDAFNSCRKVAEKRNKKNGISH